MARRLVRFVLKLVGQNEAGSLVKIATFVWLCLCGSVHASHNA